MKLGQRENKGQGGRSQCALRFSQTGTVDRRTQNQSVDIRRKADQVSSRIHHSPYTNSLCSI